MEKIAAVVLSVLVVIGIGFGWTNFNDETARAEGGNTYTPPEPSVAPAAKRVVFIGDSYTSGAGSTEGGFVQALDDSQGWVVENLGRGGTGYLVNENQDPEASLAGCGEEYCPNYPELIDEAASFEPDIVIVSGGRNNGSTPVADLRSGIPDFYVKLRRAVPDADIWAVSPLWDATPTPPIIGTVGQIVRDAVTAVGGHYIDVGQPLRGHPEWLVEDGVHPNDDGYAAIAEAIGRRLPTG